MAVRGPLRGLLISRLKVRFLHGSPFDRGAATPPDLFFWASSCSPSQRPMARRYLDRQEPRGRPSGRIGDKSSLSVRDPILRAVRAVIRTTVPERPRLIPFRADGQEPLDVPAALPGNPPGVEAQGRRRTGVAHLGGHVRDRRRGTVPGTRQQQGRERVPQIVKGMAERLLALGGHLAEHPLERPRRVG